jgi:hypothetical protein
MRRRLSENGLDRIDNPDRLIVGGGRRLDRMNPITVHQDGIGERSSYVDSE